MVYVSEPHTVFTNMAGRSLLAARSCRLTLFHKRGSRVHYKYESTEKLKTLSLIKLSGTMRSGKGETAVKEC